jgi:tryptophanyl-tRNA synthetase
MKKIILSGIRPTGRLHLGNYFGAIVQFLKLQESENQCYYFVADLHSLTTIQEKIDLKKRTLEIVKSYVACGIDPQKAMIYRQSDIRAIPALANILGMITSESLLRRCTTFKDKAKTQKVISLGLLSYPVLMAADILVVNSNIVPVGEDQLQHLEIVRDIAQRFHHLFGEVFVLPQARALEAIRVPSLDGNEKMGKSDKNTVDLLDSQELIIKKVKSAKTDLGPHEGAEMSQEMKYFYMLLKLCSSESVYQGYLQKYQNGEQKFYADMKAQLAKDIIKLTEPIKEKYYSEDCSDEKMIEILKQNADKVNQIGDELLARVQEKIGLFSLE